MFDWKRAVKFGKRNWDFVIQTMIAIVFAGLLVADHFGKVELGSKIVGSTIVGLLTFASWQLLRQSEALRSGLTDQGDELHSLREMQQMEGDIRQIPGDRISEVLNELLSKSDHWHFRGGSARWQLSRVLPELAKRRDLTSKYVMQVIDPLDSHLCERYGEYRAKSRTIEQAPSIEDGPAEVKRDILACIYAAGWYAAHFQIRPEVILLKSYSPIRVDCGRKGMMVTVAKKTSPGLLIKSDTWLYRSMLNEIEQLEEVSRKLVLPRQGNFYPPNLSAVTGDHVRDMLRGVSTESPDGTRSAFVDASGIGLDSEEYSHVADRVKESRA